MQTQNKKAAENATRRQPGKGTLYSFQFYYNRRRAARTKVIASFAGTVSEFRHYLRYGEVQVW